MPVSTPQLSHVLTPADHGTRVRIDSTESDTIDVFVGNTSDVWPVGAYVEVVNISETAMVRLVGVSSETLNLLSGTDTLEYGEYARVSQVVQGTPGVWDVHVYKLSVGAVPYAEVVFGTNAGITSSKNFRFAVSESGAAALQVNTSSSARNFSNPVWIQSGGGEYRNVAKIHLTPDASGTRGIPALPSDPIPPIGPAHIRMYAGNTNTYGRNAGSVWIHPGVGENGGYSGSAIICTESDIANSTSDCGLVISGTGSTGYLDPQGFDSNPVALYFNAHSAIGIGNNVTSETPTYSIQSYFRDANYGLPGYLLKSNGKTSHVTWESPSTIAPAPLQVVNYALAMPTSISAWHHGKSIRVREPANVVFALVLDTTWPGTDEYWQPNSNMSAMPIGGCVMIGKHGAGNIVFAPAPGVTVNTSDSLTLSKMHGKVMLMKVGPNEWDIEGNLQAL